MLHPGQIYVMFHNIMLCPGQCVWYISRAMFRFLILLELEFAGVLLPFIWQGKLSLQEDSFVLFLEQEMACVKND